jgi:hypothetical protein
MHALKFDANRTVCYYHACKPIGLQTSKESDTVKCQGAKKEAEQGFKDKLN